MQYIKYNSFSNTDEEKMLKSLYKKACSKEKIEIFKEKFFRIVGNFLLFIAFVAIFLGAIFLIWTIVPDGKNPFLNVLNGILRIVLYVFAGIVSFLLGILVATPFYNISSKKAKTLKRYFLSEACADIREFYKLSEPFLVTKCYECSNEMFSRHDVCIFIAEEQLRITTNLNYGFMNPNKDLGCYCFDKNEIEICRIQKDNLFMTELRVSSLSFLLGKNAKRFIELNFLNK